MSQQEQEREATIEQDNKTENHKIKLTFHYPNEMGFSNVQDQDRFKVITTTTRQDGAATTAAAAATTTAKATECCTCTCIKSSSSSSSDEAAATAECERQRQPTRNETIIRQYWERWISVCSDSINFIALLFLGSLSFVSSGASLAWTSTITTRMSGKTEFIDSETSWIVSVYPLSAALAVLTIFRCYHFGLKRWIVFANFCLTLSWVFALLRQVDLYLILAGRVLAGFGTGSIYLTITLYLSHFAKTTTNMKIQKAMNTMWIFGALIQYLSSSSSGAMNEKVKGELSSSFAIEAPLAINEWIVNIIMAITAFIASIGFLFFAPESPQTLVHRERYADARQLLQTYMNGDCEEIVLKMQCFTVEEVRQMPLKQVFRERTWIERLVPVFGMSVFDSLLGIRVIMFFLPIIMNATGYDTYPTRVKMMVFCLGLMFGTVIRLPLMCRTLSKSAFILSGTIIFIAFGILGTFYHMQSLNLSLANEYPWLPFVCMLLIGGYYAGGIAQNMRAYEYALTSNRNRTAVRTISLALSWLTTAAISHKFNHAIWYIGIGWIYYNLALVTLFLMAFVALVLPKVVKARSSRNRCGVSSSQSECAETSDGSRQSSDTTMEAVLVV